MPSDARPERHGRGVAPARVRASDRLVTWPGSIRRPDYIASGTRAKCAPGAREVGMQVRIGGHPLPASAGHLAYLDPSVLSRVQRCDYGDCESAWRRFGTSSSDDAAGRSDHSTAYGRFMAMTTRQDSPRWSGSAASGGGSDVSRSAGSTTRGEAAGMLLVTAKPGRQVRLRIHKYADMAGWLEAAEAQWLRAVSALLSGPRGKVSVQGRARRDYACCNAAAPAAAKRPSTSSARAWNTCSILRRRNSRRCWMACRRRCRRRGKHRSINRQATREPGQLVEDGKWLAPAPVPRGGQRGRL